VLAVTLCACTSSSNGSAPAVSESSQSAPTTDSQATSALDQYVAAERRTIPGILEATQGQYSKVDISGEPPATVVYEYTYAQPVDAATTRGILKTRQPTLKSAAETEIFPAMRSMGVSGARKLRWVYLNADGSEVWSTTVSDK
jgi:hypothetical protein